MVMCRESSMAYRSQLVHVLPLGQSEQLSRIVIKLILVKEQQLTVAQSVSACVC